MEILPWANPVITLFVARIALQQYFTNKRQVKINNEKLRLDLYNRRFEIYSKTEIYTHRPLPLTFLN